MSEPNDFDHIKAGYTESDLYQQLYPNGYQDGHAQYVQSAVYRLLEKHFAAYREEIEAKKTVPMAMLIDCWHVKTCLDELPEIVRRYGYKIEDK